MVSAIGIGDALVIAVSACVSVGVVSLITSTPTGASLTPATSAVGSRVNGLQHAIGVLVDGPDAQGQTNLRVARREGQAGGAHGLRGFIDEDNVLPDAVAHFLLPEVGDRPGDAAERVVGIRHRPLIGRSQWIVEEAGDGQQLILGRRGVVDGQQADRCIVGAVDDQRLIGELQPLDVAQRIDAVDER